MTINIFNNLNKYKHIFIYYYLIEYMQGGEKKINELKILRNRRKILQYQIKLFRLFTLDNIQYLIYIELIKAYNIYIVKKKISRFLYTIYKDYNHYVVVLTLDFLIKRIY